MGFLDQLRMNNIYGNGSPGALGPPDFNGGKRTDPYAAMAKIFEYKQRSKDMDVNRQKDMAVFGDQMQRRNKALDAQFAQQYAGANQPNTFFGGSAGNVGGPGMRVNYGGMTDYQRAQNAVAQERLDVEREKIGQRSTASDRTLDIRQQDADVRARRAQVYEFVHNLTDADKQRIANEAKAGNLEAQHQYDMILEDARQSGRETIQGMRGDSAQEIQNMRGQQGLAEISARLAGQREIEGMRQTPDAPNATQQRADYWNKAQQVINTNPQLAPFIQMGTNGSFTIEQPRTNFWGDAVGPTPEQQKQLNELIYGKGGLPPGNLTQQGPPPPIKPVPNATPNMVKPQPLTGSKYSGTVTVKKP